MTLSDKTASVHWPQRRHELLWYLYELADPVYQQQCWIEGINPRPDLMYGFDFVVHFFFDDTDLAKSPESTVGYLLLDELEVSAIRDVVAALDQVFEDVGLKGSDLEYLSSEYWPSTVISAGKAYRLIRCRAVAAGDTNLPPELGPSK